MSPALRVAMRRLRLTDAARIYRIPERSLRRWVDQGRLTAHRSGHAWMLDLAEVEQLAALRDTPAGRLQRAPRT